MRLSRVLLIGVLAVSGSSVYTARAQDVGVWRTAYVDRATMGETRAPAGVSRGPTWLPFGGTKVRFYAMHCYGAHTVVHLDKITLAKAADGTKMDGAVTAPAFAITFSGKESFTLAKTDPDQVPSDDVSVPVTEGLWYVQESCQKDSKTPYSFDNDGGFFADSHESPAPSKSDTGRVGTTFRIDVLTTDTRPSIACYGDSITASSGATKRRHIRYPDLLGKKLGLPTINLGVNGSTTQYLNGYYIRALAGVDVAVIQIGSNDIRGGWVKSLADYIKYATPICKGTQGKDGKIKVVWATILPGFLNNPDQEALRQQINAWIRGNSMGADAIVDFDKALADPNNPAKTLAEYKREDGHPNDAGDAVLATAAAAVIQKLLAKP